MVKAKKLRSGATSKARMWDALPWKAVDVDSENLGEFEESVFFGLEEIDGNAYKLSKKDGETAMRPEAVDPSEAVANVPVKKTKKGKKVSNTDTEEVDTEAAVSTEEAEDGVPSTKPTKKEKATKKRKQALVNISDIEDAIVEEQDAAPVAEKKKKQKKAKVSKPETANDDNAVESMTPGNIKALYINAPAALVTEDVSYLKNDSEWAPGLVVSDLLKQALVSLGFETPTPIQTNAIPLTTIGGTDIVGAAETGSGKTLAFSLPIIHSLLHNWETCSNLRIPHALIVAPTRELALQISSVIREVCAKVQQLCEKYQTDAERAESEANASESADADVAAEPVVAGQEKLSKKAQKALKKKQQREASAKSTDKPKRAKVCIEIVSIVGGMSEQKQRRQLAGKGKPVHIVVATPGRLCEMFEDPDNVSFQDMSKLRFLVVDEADRIMEEGHYAELHRVFSRIKDHEEIAQRGEDPVTVNKAKAKGTFEDADADITGNGGDGDNHNHGAAAEEAMDIEDLDMGEVDVPMMPTEEELQAMRDEYEALGVDAYHADAHLIDEEDNGGAADASGPAVIAVDVGRRQTLLFSATAIHAAANNANTATFDKKAKAQKKLKLKGTLKGISQNNTLPEHLKQLLSMVGIQKSIHVVDMTSQALAKKAPKLNADGSVDASAVTPLEAKEGVHRLPAGLTQEELHVPSEEKDVYAYYYLNKFPGRSLIFVNSIKTARRLDGLLRALGVNCRTLHAQLQQKQRLNALESFSDLPVGVLVATDVAARGLDISKIQSVIHYDVARSPQVYVHRSGRTARANQTGTTVSLVSPEDASHHRAICGYLGFKALPLLHVDLYSLPMLRQRVTLAKQIFVQSFVASQASKDKHWLAQSCKDADLEVDEYMQQEFGGAEDEGLSEDLARQKEVHNKKAIAAAKYQLQNLLDAPIPDARTFNNVLKKKNRAESRGGKVPPSAEVLAGRAKAKLPGHKKGKNKAAPVVEEATWKRRSSFFVFAK